MKKRILYCGWMRSNFAKVDAEMLAAMGHNVTIVNMSEIASRYTQLPVYLLRYFTQIVPGTIKADIVWIWTADYFTLPIVLTARLFGKKTVVHIGGYEIHNDPEVGYGNQRFRIRGAISRYILKPPTSVIVQSLAYVTKLTRLIPGSKIHMVPAAVTIPDVTRLKDESVMTAYMNYTGAERIKGISTYRRAVAQLPYRSVIMVDQPHEELMLSLKQTKVYCQLSYTEQFGQVVLEAMSCGCIPVVSDRGGLPELVGDAGIVVPYGNVKATVEAIQEAMKMDSDKAIERAKDYHLSRKFGNLSMITEPELWTRHS